MSLGFSISLGLNRPLSALGGAIARIPTTSATSVTHGDVTFPLDATYEVGNYVDGPAFIVLPSGTLNMSEPTPVQSTIDGELVNGAMANPELTSSSGDGVGFDARPGAAGSFDAKYNASLVASSWPRSMLASDIVIKAVSSSDVLLDIADSTSMRRGVVESYGACFIVSEAPLENSFSPSATGWTGRGTPAAHIVNVASRVASLPSYDTTGHDTPTYSDLINAMGKFYPCLPMFGDNPYGHRYYAPKGMGTAADLYGQNIAGTLQGAMLALISDDFSTPEKETIAKALISMGNQFYDAYEGAGVEQWPNGGLYQFAFPAMALALDWRGDTAKLATLRSTYGGNFRQAFTLTSSQALQLQRHTSNDQPYTWRERNLDAISGTTFTISTYRLGSAGDNTKGSFTGLFLTNGTARTLVTADEASNNISSSGVGDFDITVSSATGFSVDDIIWFEPYATPTEGASEWAIEGDETFNQYSPVGAGYRGINEWSGAVLFLRAADIWHAEWNPVEDYVFSANETNYPSAGYDWATHHNEVQGHLWEADFWADHAGSILSNASNIPAQMAAPALTASSPYVISVDHAAAPLSPGASITQYDLRWSLDETTWIEATDISDPETISGLTSGTEYFVQTRAVNSVGAGPWSDANSQTTNAVPAGVPDQMSAPAVSASSSTAISVDRASAPADNGNAITQYDLRHSTDGIFWTTVSDVADPQSVTSLSPSTLYYTQTRAVNSVGPAQWSASASVTTLPVPSTIVVDEGSSTGAFSSHGGYRIWKGTATGHQLVVTTAGVVEMAMVGHGGDGGARRGGGGGGGEVVERTYAKSNELTLTAATHAATVGASSADDTTFFSLTALPGGDGGDNLSSGSDGGSGGGAGAGGVGGSSIASDGVGFDGGDDSANATRGGAGGGAGAAAVTTVTNGSADGAIGILSPVPGETTYLGSGAGSGRGGLGAANAGDGGVDNGAAATSGAAETGGGGGGGADSPSGNRSGAAGAIGSVTVFWPE